MSGVRTSIELQDNFTNILMNVISAVNMSVSTMEQMQSVMSEPIDTAGIQGIQDQLNQATIATQELSAAMKSVESPAAGMSAVPVQLPISQEWQSFEGPEVFTNTGLERTEQEIASVNSLLRQLGDTQYGITQQANESEVLSPQAAYDVQMVENRIQGLMDMIQRIEENPLNLGTDAANAGFERLRGHLDQVMQQQESLGQAMQGMDTGEVNGAYLRLSQEISDAERLVRDSFKRPVEVPVEWKTDDIEVFHGNGIERFGQEAQAAAQALSRLSESQREISQQADGMQFLPAGAASDLQGLEDRIAALQDRITQATASPVNLNMGTDQANAEMERLRGHLDQLVQQQEGLSQAMQGMDISQINEAYLRLSNNVAGVERSVRDGLLQQVEVPVTWNTDSLEVFAGTGMERFGMEVQSANGMLDTLSQKQAQIAARAAQSSLFPPGMAADMNSMQTRLQMIQSRIQMVESNPLNMGTDQANAELEQLRAQLDRAVREQELMNRAVENMDVQAANEAYLRLSQTVGNTERYIRDNVDEQGRFNQEVSQGKEEADGLIQTIQKAVAAYATMQTAGNIIGLSDTMAQTEARLSMLVNVDDGGSVEQLQDMIYLSAERARGGYQSTADAVSKLGLMAGNAFSGNEEIIAFTEQLSKQFVIAGTEAAGIDAAMLQLTQAMGSGVLRGEEYNSILEQAPNIVQNIGKYIEGNEDVLNSVAAAMGMKAEELAGNVQGHLKDIAGEGLLSAELVKNAMFFTAEETNAKFESMPKTFGQIWTSFQNHALMAFQPVLGRLNEIANSTSFQEFANGAIDALAVAAGLTMEIFGALQAGGAVLADNWSWISPIIYGAAGALAVYGGYLAVTKGMELASAAAKGVMVLAEYAHAAATGTAVAATTAETAAQMGLNTAFLACPITWIILMVIALIAAFYAAVGAVNHFAGTSVSATGIIAGVFAVLGAHIANSFVVPTWNGFASLANFVGNVFNDPVAAVKVLFYDMCLTVVGYIQNLAASIETLLNKIPGVTVDITSGLDHFYSGLEQAQQAVKDESGWVEYVQKMDYIDYRDAASAGYSFGEGIADSIAGFDPSSLFNTNIPDAGDYADLSNYGTGVVDTGLADIGSGVDDIAGNTGAIADAMDITEEELKYMRDLAEQETINRYTTAEIKIDQSGMQNTVSRGDDLTRLLAVLTDAVGEAVEMAAEGVHQ